MAQRRITRTGKSNDDDITSLCNRGKYWSPVSKQSAIRDIENDFNTYYVKLDGRRVDIHVVNGEDGKYLRTDPDETDKNNLLELPDC